MMPSLKQWTQAYADEVNTIWALPFFQIMFSPITWQDCCSKAFQLISSWSHGAALCASACFSQHTEPVQIRQMLWHSSSHDEDSATARCAPANLCDVMKTGVSNASQCGKMWRLYVIDKLQLSSQKAMLIIYKGMMKSISGLELRWYGNTRKTIPARSSVKVKAVAPTPQELR